MVRLDPDRYFLEVSARVFSKVVTDYSFTNRENTKI